MKKVYEIDLSTKGIKELQKGLKEYEKFLKSKCGEMCKRLAEIGVTKAQAYFKIPYDGENDVVVDWENRGECEVAVVATGLAVLFLEFGSGILMGSGHKEPMGFGPGTYNPESDNWKNPDGWIYAHDKPRSYGNAPSAAMYTSRKEVEMEIERVAREVFKL